MVDMVVEIIHDIGISHFFLTSLPLFFIIGIKLNLFKLTKISISILLLTNITGFALWYSESNLNLPIIIHAILGILLTILFSKKFNFKTLFSITLLATITGVYTHYGHYYFFPVSFKEDPLYKNIKVDHQLNIFEKNISTILNNKCLKCHHSSNNKIKIKLDTIKDLYTFHSNSAVILPYDATKSLLYKSISAHPSRQIHMPKYKGMLSAKDVKIIKDWINKGAFKFKASQTRPINFKSLNYKKTWMEETEVPKEITSITSYYETTLNNARIQYNKKAKDQNQIKKEMSLKLTGFLPHYFTKKELNLNSLINTQEYAEQMSIRWMDFSAHADTNGDNDNTILKGANKYKHFLQNSFKEDLNYFVFLKKQIENLKKKHTILPVYSFYKYRPFIKTSPRESLENAFYNIFQFTLGVNISCAKCHDHKDIPISNEEYYQHQNSLYPIFLDPTVYSQKQRELQERRLLRNQKLADSYIRIFNKPNHANFINYITDEENIGFQVARNYVDFIWKRLLGKSFISDNSDHINSSINAELLPLLNWLTQDFLKNGASTKYLVKRIMNSSLFTHEYLNIPNEYSLAKKKVLYSENIRDNLLSLADSLSNSQEFENEITPLEELNKSPLKKSFYYPRNRDFSNDLFADYMKIPKGQISRAKRQLNLGFELANSMLDDQFINQILKRFSKKYNLIKYEEDTIKKIYLDFFYRLPSSKELKIWNDFFSANDITDKEKLFFHLLISSDEFLRN